jgi:hypothetical protein
MKVSPALNEVNPGVHSVPAGPEHSDFGAGGTSVTEVLFLGIAAATAAIKLRGIAFNCGAASIERLLIRQIAAFGNCGR